MNADLLRAQAFSQRLGLAMPLLMAPMAGVPAIALASAVGQAGGMAALGALLMPPQDITDWVLRYRKESSAPLQINLWVPDPAPVRDAAQEQRLRDFLSSFGPAVPQQAADARPLDFDSQCEAVLAARPAALSTIMGLLPSAWVQRCKAAGVPWWATVTSVAEARAAAAAGADVIVAQGAEAGGHRGAFDASTARDRAVGLMALLPQVVDAVSVPVVATGGVADARLLRALGSRHRHRLCARCCGLWRARARSLPSAARPHGGDAQGGRASGPIAADAGLGRAGGLAGAG